MFVYLGFLVLLAGLIFLASHAPPPQGKGIVFFIFIILIGFSGLRGIVGSDTASYLLFYERFKDYDVVKLYLTKMEPVFVLLLALHSNMIDSKFLYLLMMSFFQAWLLWLIYKRSSSRYLFLLSYIFVFYFNFHFNTTRAAIAIMLLLIALTSESKKAKIASALLAPGFHFSVLFFYPLLFTRITFKYIIASTLLLLLICFLAYQNLDYLILKYASYQDYSFKKTTPISITGLLFSFSIITSVVVLRTSSRLFFGAALFALIALGISEFYPIGYRLWIFAFLIYLYFLLEELSSRTSKVNYLLFWAPVSLYFIISIYSMYNETATLERRISEGEDLEEAFKSTYIPYEFYWDDKDIDDIR